MSDRAKNFRPDTDCACQGVEDRDGLDWRSVCSNARGLAQDDMGFIGGGEHHLVGNVLGIIPLLSGPHLRRLDWIGIKERGLIIAYMRERILHQLVNRLYVVCTEGCDVGGVSTSTSSLACSSMTTSPPGVTIVMGAAHAVQPICAELHYPSCSLGRVALSPSRRTCR
jgi:hypothetical protein